MNIAGSLAVLRAERLSCWALTVFAFFAVASIAMQNFVFLAIAAWLISMGLKREWNFTRTPLNWPLLLLAAVLILSSVLAGRLNPTIFGLRKVGLLAVFFLTTALVTHPIKADRILNQFLIGAVICSSWSIIAHLAGLDGGRAQSFSGDYMAAGGMYMLAFILSLSRFLFQKDKQQWFWLSCAGLLGLALLFTYTRSSWVGAGVGLLFLGIMRDWRLPVVFVLAAILFLVVFPKNPISQRVFSLTVKHHSSNAERRYMWGSAFKLIKARPLRGYGVDNLSEVYGKVANPKAIEQRPPHVHNTLMQMAINGGLPAAGLYIWWIMVVLLFGLLAWRKNRKHAVARSGTALGIIAGFIGFVVNGLFEFNFGTSQVITIVYFLIGLLPAFVHTDPAGPDWVLPKKPRLLFLRPRFRGDVLLASPIPRLIKRDYPQAQVDLLTEPACVGAAGGEAGWSRILSMSRYDLMSWWQTIRQLRAGNYDVACDLFGNPRTALLVFMSGARFKIGPRVTAWEYLFHLITKPNQKGKRPAWESYFDILRSFGMKQLSLRPRWKVSEEDDVWIRSFFKERRVQPGKVIGVFPGGSHSAKRWPLKNFLDVARLTVEKFGMKTMFVFGPAEKDLKLDYMHAAGKLSLSVEGLPPARLAALWSHCALVLSNDAFPMHLGPAVNTPTLGLFGPGEPEVWFPYSKKKGHRVLHDPQSCWPCHQDECAKLDCWKHITPEYVIEIMAEVLQAKKNVGAGSPNRKNSINEGTPFGSKPAPQLRAKTVRKKKTAEQ
ncbi:O-antigen ligase family protein [bacterium]|nr:O-antigen ligase family protein [bacterium]